ncbi:hypothetical protein IMSAGC001_01795 [Bacteroides acidifaciens]|uniref:Uncharacterized protein n=1 Tax=Bacteroides acidifaciens TaxID=85831 RepID=A0A7J0A275_9BACE|nr:hypothetical protein IMSAGC001_01795 [Bacteroides acidifaciens]
MDRSVSFLMFIRKSMFVLCLFPKSALASIVKRIET